jgi:hypothetical protein
MDRLGWLHLTDLHFGLSDQGALWPNIKQAFFDDLARLHETAGPWQLVMFSGDLVQQGSKAEFERLENMVLEPLWNRLEQLGSTPSLLAVPGNHDLIRPDAHKPRAVVRQLLRTNGFREIADEFFHDSGSEYREPITSAFAEYMAWWERTAYRHRNIRAGFLPGDFSVSIDTGDFRLGVVGLNTTFLQLSGGDYRRKLVWDVRQFNAACTGDTSGDGPDWVRQHDFCFLMTHHGPQWLDEHSLDVVYPEINPAGRFGLHLFGHMHETVLRGTSSGGGAALWQWQGHSLFGLEKYGDPPVHDRRHGYAAGVIAAADHALTVRLWPRTAHRDSNGWRFERDTTNCKLVEGDGGTEPIVLPRAPRSKDVSRPRPPASEPSVASIREQEALEIYVRAARPVWDIVDLAGLPEGERHIAMQRFLLRQLFVPLRLSVELKEDEDHLQQLEVSRARRRAADAGHFVMTDASPTRTVRASIGERLTGWIAPDMQQGSTDGKAVAGEPAPPRLVVLGDPGGGKTTLLRWLATALLMRFTRDAEYECLPDARTLPDRDWLPVLVRCRDLDKSSIERGKLSLDGVLRQTLRQLELPAAQMEPLVELLRQRIARGRALLLLDGLDEISDPRLRAQFCGWMEKVASQVPCPLIATSRIVGYREMKRRLGTGFEHATVADLTPEDKLEFLRRWCEVTISDPARRQPEFDKLRAAVQGERSDRIARLTGNPMLLTTLALVQRKVGKLPSRRHKLYWEAVDVLLNWRADVDEPLDPEEALPQLEYVAYAMCERGVQRLRRDELLALLDAVRREYPHIRPVHGRPSEAFLAQLEARTGLLVEAGRERFDGHLVPVYEFRHLTFQEYLAALALIKGRFPGHTPRTSLAERVAPLAARLDQAPTKPGTNEVMASWNEVLRLCVASCNDDDVEAVLATILDPDAAPVPPDRSTPNTITSAQPSNGGHRPRAVLAALCLADEPNVTQASALRVLQCFAAQVPSDPDRRYGNLANERAALALADSAWRDSCLAVLVNDFKARPANACIEVGSLVASVGSHALDESGRLAWLTEQPSRLMGELDTALVAALSLMNIGHQVNSAPHAPKLAVPNEVFDALIRLASRGPNAAVAASWALMWLGRAKTNPADRVALVEPLLLDPSIPWRALWFLKLLVTHDAVQLR